MDIGQLVGVPSEESVARRVRKGNDRDQRDLFATPRPQHLPPVRVGAASEAPSGMSGERNENSVLFTVADLKRGALTKSSTMPPPAMTPAAEPLPSSPPPAARRDEEGMFDLLAMCRDGGQVKARTAPLFEVESPFGPPAKSASQADGLSMSILPEQEGKKKLGIIIGVAAAAVVFLGVGMAVALRGNEPEVKASAAVAAPPPVSTTVAIPIAQPSADPVAASSATTAKDDKPVAAKAGGKKGGGKATATSGAKSGGKLTLTSTGAPPAPKAKKGGGDPCGCHGNLQCAMRCGM